MIKCPECGQTLEVKFFAGYAVLCHACKYKRAALISTDKSNLGKGLLIGGIIGLLLAGLWGK